MNLVPASEFPQFSRVKSWLTGDPPLPWAKGVWVIGRCVIDWWSGVCICLGDPQSAEVKTDGHLQNLFLPANSRAHPALPPAHRGCDSIRLTLTNGGLQFLQSRVGLRADNAAPAMKQVLIGCQALWSSLWGSHWLLIGSCIKEPNGLQKHSWNHRDQHEILPNCLWQQRRNL